MRVKAERENQSLRLEGANSFGCRLYRRGHRLSIGAMRKGQVEIEAFPRSAPRFAAIAGEKGIIVHGIGVDRNGQDVGAVVENLLRAVAMMRIDVEDRDALVSRA
jgi:hypothetical protein